jgi:hypothetical protein
MRFAERTACPRLQLYIFGQIARSEQLLDIKELRLIPTARHRAKQHQLRMLGLVDVDYHGQELVDAEAAVMQVRILRQSRRLFGCWPLKGA